MSQENVEIAKGLLSRFEAGDRQEWREHFDPNVVWDTSASELPAASVYHGHQGVERFFRDWLETWTDYEVATRGYIDAGNAVVVFRQSGTGRGIERDFRAVPGTADGGRLRGRYEAIGDDLGGCQGDSG